MEFENSFDVPLPPEQAWPLLLDVARIVPCVPGAELTQAVDPTTFRGKVAVRLGPVALSFAGTVKFIEIDPPNYRARIDARGSDSKGRGNATATVGFQLQPSAEGSRVVVRTNLTLAGSVAQYGRAIGLVRELAGQITTEFAQRLRAQIGRQDLPSQMGTPAGSEPETTSVVRSESLSAGRLIWRALMALLRNLLARKQK